MSWAETVKGYGKRVMSGYLDFATPVALFLVFNLIVTQSTRDPEKFGLLWLNFAQHSAEERKEKFPTDEPGSIASPM